jgi:hypothetical protein
MENMTLASVDVTVYDVIREIIGGDQVDAFSQTVLIPSELASFGDENVSRAQLSMSLFLVLYADLLDRVPHARTYFDRRRNDGETIFLDHGAVRTVLTERNGSLPAGQESLTRILVPLGYFYNHTYPLPKLKMTGRSYTHEDYPELIPQYFVSELHPEQVDDDNFNKAVIETVEDSAEPLGQDTFDDLAFIAEHKYLPRPRATNFLANVASAFNRQHPVPLLTVYEELRKHSAEMAWIATEGNAFNHATDRVADVMELAENERNLDMPIKESVEVSGSGNVLQTAYKADSVSRAFRLDDNEIIHKDVPGSFFEFITRHNDEQGNVDLAFDANNATGIFAMTKSDEPVLVEFPDDEDEETD